MVVKEKEKPNDKYELFWHKLVDSHSRFLEEIKNVYPLGVLGSLSIAIAAFAASLAEDFLVLAQTYAIAASLMFLTAFICSLSLRILLPKREYVALEIGVILSYIFTALGVIFLFLVVYEFIASVPSLATFIEPMLMLIVLGIALFPLSSVVYVAKASKSKRVLTMSYLAVICFFLTYGGFIVTELKEFDAIPLILQLVIYLMMACAGIAGLLFIILTVALTYKKTRRERK